MAISQPLRWRRLCDRIRSVGQAASAPQSFARIANILMERHGRDREILG